MSLSIDLDSLLKIQDALRKAVIMIEPENQPPQYAPEDVLPIILEARAIVETLCSNEAPLEKLC
jgi:hypothetical protein